MDQNIGFGGLEFLIPEPNPARWTEVKIGCKTGGTVTKYFLPGFPIIKNSFRATIFNKSMPVNVISDENGLVLEEFSIKDKKDYVIDADLDFNTGMLLIRWNRTQKPGKTLISAKYKTKCQNLS